MYFTQAPIAMGFDSRRFIAVPAATPIIDGAGLWLSTS